MKTRLRVRRDRFGREITPGSTLTLGWGWRTRQCTGPCRMQVGVFEIPAGYLDELGPYVCGDWQTAPARPRDGPLTAV